MGTSKTAQNKIFWLRQRFQMISQEYRPLSKKKIIAQFCLNNASTPRKAAELLKMFEEAGEISIFGDLIGSQSMIKELMGKCSTEQDIL